MYWYVQGVGLMNGNNLVNFTSFFFLFADFSLSYFLPINLASLKVQIFLAFNLLYLGLN
jgi:hypothetical protein